MGKTPKLNQNCLTLQYFKWFLHATASSINQVTLIESSWFWWATQMLSAKVATGLVWGKKALLLHRLTSNAELESKAVQLLILPYITHKWPKKTMEDVLQRRERDPSSIHYPIFTNVCVIRIKWYQNLKRKKKKIARQLTWVRITLRNSQVLLPYFENLSVHNNHKKRPYEKLPPLWVTKIWQSTQAPYQTLWWMHTTLNHTKSNPVQLKVSANPEELSWISKATLFHEHPCSCTRQRAYCTIGWYWPILLRVPR